MAHELTEKLAGLASRVNDLAVATTGEPSRELLALQKRLTQQTLEAIAQALDAQDAAYKKAMGALDDAIDAIDEADEAIEGIARKIRIAAKAADAVEKLLKKLVG
jgi:hypothetical protein